MSETERDAIADLRARAELVRQAAHAAPDPSQRLRLAVGAIVLEQTADFIYWRGQPARAARAAAPGATRAEKSTR